MTHKNILARPSFPACDSSGAAASVHPLPRFLANPFYQTQPVHSPSHSVYLVSTMETVRVHFRNPYYQPGPARDHPRTSAAAALAAFDFFGLSPHVRARTPPPNKHTVNRPFSSNAYWFTQPNCNQRNARARKRAAARSQRVGAAAAKALVLSSVGFHQFGKHSPAPPLSVGTPPHRSIPPDTY